MKEINLTINGIPVKGVEGDTILDVANKNNIFIPTLCHSQYVKEYGACGLCVVEAEGIPKLLRACSVKAADSMVVNTESDRVVRSRKITLELLMSDHKGDCLGPCVLNCPAETACQEYVKQIALGNNEEAVRVIKEKIPLPASIGRICPHPCEKACRRQYVEEPISIAFLKAYAADKVLASGKHILGSVQRDTGKKVCIIGGGPAGLTSAYYLRLKGHSVTVFDKMPKMGGMLRYGIPEYRLPKNVLDEEVNEIASLGVEMINNFKLGESESLDSLNSRFDAVILAVGAWKSSSARCKGDELNGVVGGIDFLREIALGSIPDIGKNVAVVGGGNTAMDACRSAVRCKAENVYVIYRRTRNEMPAEDVEIEEAIEEGVQFKFLTNPAEFIGENGRVKTVKLQVMELGEPDEGGRRSPVPVEGKFEYLDVDTVINAIGQKLDSNGLNDIELNSRGNIVCDPDTFETNIKGVFAIGDAVNTGASIAVQAIAHAGKVSDCVDRYLNGLPLSEFKKYVSKKDFDPSSVSDKEKIDRVKMPVRDAKERKSDFSSIYLGLSDEQAQAEAKRCLECGCFDYHECSLIKNAQRYNIDPTRLNGSCHTSFTEKKLVSIERDQGKCILCSLCVRTCDENAKQGILGLVGRGFNTVIKPEFKDSIKLSFCKDCKKCVDICPTGALKLT